MYKGLPHLFLMLACTAMIFFSTGFAVESGKARASNDSPNVMLILDSSRSMWGQIEGVNKVVSSRKVVSDIVKEIEGEVTLGLVSYGHRQASGCDDIEVLLPPGQHKPADIAKKVNSIKPKGSTPIAASLIKAAEAVRYKETPASLILVADGLDNCEANPCETAEQLKETGKELTIHAIAFDAKQKEKLTALNCLAEKTGGTFYSAVDEQQLGDSLRAVFKSVIAAPKQKIAAAALATLPSEPAESILTPQAQPAPEQAMPKADPLATGSIENAVIEQAQAQPKQSRAEPETATNPNESVPVTLSATTVEGGAIIKAGLVWWIYKNEKTKDGKYQLVETLREATPTAALKPGSYRIAAAYGKVNLIKDIEVQSGRALQEIFVLNAGGLRLAAATHDGATIPPNAVRYDLYADESESDQYGNRKLLLRDVKPGVVLRLNAGAYHVVSTYGDANAIVRADVTVEPGKLTDATINHSAAKVTLKLVNQPGGEALADTQWNILTPGGDIVKESAGALPSHILAAGSYSVLARHGGKNYTREFSVDPGETKQIEVVIQ